MCFRGSVCVQQTPRFLTFTLFFFFLSLLCTQPSVIRVAPAPLYNTAAECLYFVRALERVNERCISEGKIVVSNK